MEFPANLQNRRKDLTVVVDPVTQKVEGEKSREQNLPPCRYCVRPTSGAFCPPIVGRRNLLTYLVSVSVTTSLYWEAKCCDTFVL